MASDHRPIIMAIDDDPVTLNLAVVMLRRTYRLRPFTSGKAAFKFMALPGSKVDLILLDHQMPDMDGPEILKKLRADEATSRIPVIFMTGLDDDDELARLKELGAADCVRKPPVAADLLEKISRRLASPSPAPAAA